MNAAAFAQIERDYAEELARTEEAKAQIAEWRASIRPTPTEGDLIQRSAIDEHASMQVRQYR